MSGPSPVRGQQGLDRLLLFVFLAIGVVFVAPHVLGVAGIDVQGGGSPAAETTTDHDLTVLAARGEAVAGDGSSVGAVRLVVSPAPGRAPVDLQDSTVIWIGEESLDLVPTGTDAEDADAQYGASVSDGDGTVLESDTDRGVLRFDLGSDDVADVPEFGDRLQAGETATVILVTSQGETLTRELRVPPDVAPGTDEVWL